MTTKEDLTMLIENHPIIITLRGETVRIVKRNEEEIKRLRRENEKLREKVRRIDEEGEKILAKEYLSKR